MALASSRCRVAAFAFFFVSCISYRAVAQVPSHAHWFAVLRDTLPATRDTVVALLRRAGADTAMQRLPGMLRFSTPDSVTPAMAQLVQRNPWAPFVLFASFDPATRAPLSTGGSDRAGLWNLAAIGADTACQVYLVCGQGTIGVDLDCGSSNPLLHVIGWYNDAPTADTSLYADVPACNSHGDHTAGTIAGPPGIGMAPRATLYVMRVADASGGIYQSLVEFGFMWAGQQHWDAANASVGFGGCSGNWSFFTQPAHDSGLALVGAAGNDGSNYSECPGGAPGVWSIAAWNGTGLAGFSNSGPSITMSEPGTSIYSTLSSGYGYKDGTSMATPHATGEVLLLRTVRPHRPVDSLLADLCASATPVANGGCGVPNVAAVLRTYAAAGQPMAVTSRVEFTPGVPFAGCTDMTGRPAFSAYSDTPWLTWSQVGSQLCWTATPPANATAASLTIRGQ